MEYDHVYTQNEAYFGSGPEKILRDYYHLMRAKKPVLDIGAGQGRHSVFLGREGFTVHALEPSRVAINTIYEVSKLDHLPIRTINSDFFSFTAFTNYSGILIFGLIQILSREEIETLVEKISLWSKPGCLLFITAFTTSDPSYEDHAKHMTRVGKNSFVDAHERHFTYLEPNEVLDLFPHKKLYHHWEGMGPEHRHSDGPTHKHGFVQAVLER